ncbi:MAG: RNA 2'-phosphotransferase [Desulfobacterales bacterium]
MKSLKNLSKFIVYILGRKPDEFGLVPDENGYIKIKELLKVLSEEDGFRSVRRSDLDEIMLAFTQPPFEIYDKLIRAIDRKQLPEIVQARQPPKLLYTCVRKKAHRFAIENGIFPVGHAKVVLAADAQMAKRIGRRFDGEPVLMIVQVAKSLERGVIYFQIGNELYLADAIPVGCFTGPALPKEKMVINKPKATVEPVESLPGSYFPDLSPKKERTKQEYLKKKKDIAWKKERKRKQKTGEKW